jgi:HSP20 family molecular chaperone IbpA
MAVLTSTGRPPAFPHEACVEELPSEYIVHLAVPDYAVDDLDVEVFDHVVTVRGDHSCADLGGFRVLDRLEERLALPADADADRVTAAFVRGELQLHAPRFEGGAPPPRKVAIQRPFAVNADASGV